MIDFQLASPAGASVDVPVEAANALRGRLRFGYIWKERLMPLLPAQSASSGENHTEESIRNGGNAALQAEAAGTVRSQMDKPLERYHTISGYTYSLEVGKDALYV